LSVSKGLYLYVQTRGFPPSYSVFADSSDFEGILQPPVSSVLHMAGTTKKSIFAYPSPRRADSLKLASEMNLFYSS
jgi:hypothetical protein